MRLVRKSRASSVLRFSRIIDGGGKPIPHAHVRISEWKGADSLSPNNPNIAWRDTKIPQRADANGIWEWTWAPVDYRVQLQIDSHGFAPYSLEIMGGAPLRTVTLNAERGVKGR